jgi:hypothetical protein
MPRYMLTPDDRRRGQAKGAETKRERRDEAEQQARDTLADAAGRAEEALRERLATGEPLRSPAGYVTAIFKRMHDELRVA